MASGQSVSVTSVCEYYRNNAISGIKCGCITHNSCAKRLSKLSSVSEHDSDCCSKHDEKPHLNDQDELEIPNITEISKSVGLKIGNIYVKSLLRHKDSIIRNIEIQHLLVEGSAYSADSHIFKPATSNSKKSEL
ncbi:hypothetical protein JTB14_017111 [Gonioctena quinquepunctata]|nr:hypothetical protein JTB14_017111 [Gonioctena quinquepunctata]